MTRGEEHVIAIVSHLNQIMTDLFDVESHRSCLISILSVMHAHAVEEVFNMSKHSITSTLNKRQLS